MCRRLIPILLVTVAMAAREVPVAPVVEGAAVLSQYAESAASDGSDYLFVWIDGQTGGYERRATRVTREGEVLDRDGIRLPSVFSRNSVVWTGTSYLIVWDEGYPGGIRGLRIGRDGKIIDGPRTLREGAAAMSVTSNGSHVVIGYHTHQSELGSVTKRALFLDSEAEIVADVLLDESSSRGAVNLGWNGSHFAAVWIDDEDPVDPRYAVKAIRFGVNGTLDAAARRLFEDSAPTYVATPALASDGNNFLMVTRTAGDRQVARRISADLDAVDPPELLPALNYELLPQMNLSSPILWNGTNYLMVGHDGQAISAVRIDRNGRPAGVEVIENTSGLGTLANPVAVTNGRDLLVGWTGRFSPDPDIGTDVFGTLVSASTLDRRASTLLSVSPQHQRKPLIASGGTNLLAVWQQGLALYARRLAQDGSPVDALPLRLAERGTPAAVVFNGSDYIVVWPQTVNHQVTGLVTARVPRDGPLRVDGGTTLPNAVPLVAASDGVATLLAWSIENEVHVGRLGADGSIAASVTLAPPPDEGWYGEVAIAPGAGEFLIVWEEMHESPIFQTPPVAALRVRGTRMSRELIPLDPAGIDIGVEGRDERWPAVTFNGREWLVVFRTVVPSELPDWAYRPELRGRLVSREGVAGGAAEGVFIAPGGEFPAVAWDGSRYFLTWYGGAVNTSRTATLAALGQPVSRETIFHHVFEWSPVPLVAIRPGVVAATYARTTIELPYGDVSRAFVNFLSVPARRRAVR
ncbi:MAG TPA: hypothetical protein VE974_15470 [Thermoanaerobaculia bacterium]|nr:hypothetical protein [Thermoanaerobaculia bacterium]